MERCSLQVIPTDAASSGTAWAAVLDARRRGARCTAGEPWDAVYGPLLQTAGPAWVIGQLGQSLDGRIATPTGHSHYVNGREAIVHLHRLRALVDAVLVGVGTVVADDPALTVRHVPGPSPCRVIVDPHGRAPAGARVFADDGVRRIAVIREGTSPALPAGVEVIRVEPGADGALAPAAIVGALAARGLARLLVEGGAATLSRFVAARRVHRLHVAVAPLIIGSGPVGLSLPPIDRLDEALRPRARTYALGEDVLWDVVLPAGA
jgi:riboflavin-specific deaminase-like protein